MFPRYALLGDFKSSVQEQPGSSSVIQSIANDRFGIGYSGIGYKTAAVRRSPSSTERGKLVTPNAENAYLENIPLFTFYLSVNYKPGSGQTTSSSS